MKKSLLSTLLCLCLALALLPAAALAVDPPTYPIGTSGEMLPAPTGSWGSNTDADWLGDYNATTDWVIKNAAELAAFAAAVNGDHTFENKTVTLTADLDMKAHIWTAIGDNPHAFSGTFDGAGHSVSGLYFNGDAACVGLFGNVAPDGTVKNASVINSYLYGRGANVSAGGLAGYNSGTIMNCYNTGSVTASGDGGYAGGVAGYSSGTIMSCYNTGSVTTAGGSSSAGGVAGYNSGTIMSCYNTGSVTVSGDGGSAGGVAGCSSGTIMSCYYQNTAAASAVGSGAGTAAALPDAQMTATANATDDAWVDIIAGVVVGKFALVDALNAGAAAFNSTDPEPRAAAWSQQTGVNNGCPYLALMSVTTAALPDGQPGVAYHAALKATSTAGSITWTVIDGALPAGLELDGGTGVISGKPTQAGSFTFTVKAASGSADSGSRQFTVAIIAAPTLTEHPGDLSTERGMPATFTVAATGYPTPTYQWEYNTGSGWTEITEATGASYTIPVATNAMNGYQFHCIVKNSKGSITSDPATLLLVSSTYTMDFSHPESTSWGSFTYHNFSTTDASGPGWNWDASKKRLAIKGLDFTTTASRALIVPDGTTINVSGENTITVEGSGSNGVAVIATNGSPDASVRFQGIGNLTAAAVGTGCTGHISGLEAGGGVTFTDGLFTFTTKDAATTGDHYSIHAGGTISITDCTVTATSGNAVGANSRSMAICGNNSAISIRNSKVTATSGEAAVSMAICGSVYDSVKGEFAYFAPDLSGYTYPCIATASTDASGTPEVAYHADDFAGYQYFHAEPIPGYTMDFRTNMNKSWGSFTQYDFGCNDASAAGWSWDASEKQLTLHDFHFETSALVAMILPDGAKVVLEGNSRLASLAEDSFGLEVEGDVALSGGGSLTCSGSTGIKGEDITVNGASVTGVGHGREGVRATGVAVADGTLSGTSDSNFGICCTTSGSVIVKDGGLLEGRGNDGVWVGYGSINVNGGSVVGAGKNSAGVLAKSLLSVTGGTLTGTSDNGVGVNVIDGGITINGGSMKGFGKQNSDCSGVLCSGNISITGGGSLEGRGSSGIFGGNGDITVNGGSVAGYGVGYLGIQTSTLSVTDGTLTAASSNYDYALLVGEAFLTGCTAVASENTNGEPRVPCQFDELFSYKYVHVEPIRPVTVSYDANGGGGTMPDGAATAEVAFTLRNCAFTPPANKQFDQWAIGDADSNIKAAENSVYTFTADTTVYALWKELPPSVPLTYSSYTLTFNTNGGSAMSAVTCAGDGVIYLSAYVPTRDGWAFTGWYADSSLTERITSVRLRGNITVCAGWRRLQSMDGFQPTGTYNGYSDVDESRWYGTEHEGTVRDAVRLGLMEGYGNGCFGPEDTLKVGEAIKIACVIHSIYMGDGFDFTQGETWYDAYVTYAIANNIIKSGDFTDYTADCTRAQAAYILAHALPESELAAIKTLTPPDVAITDPYGAEIYRLYAAGVLCGTDENGTFISDVPFTRAQAAAIAARMCVPDKR